VRALIWAIIVTLVAAYFVIANLDRLPEFGDTLMDSWPFISIVVGLLILFRRKGRPKHDFFFNNTRIQKQLEELNQRKPK
jgi:hypothetical protein